MKEGDGRYQIYERMIADKPSPHNKAQAMARFSGMFDLIDENGWIVCTSRNLKYLRQRQAILNTQEILG